MIREHRRASATTFPMQTTTQSYSLRFVRALVALLALGVTALAESDAPFAQTVIEKIDLPLGQFKERWPAN